MQLPVIQILQDWLADGRTIEMIHNLGGYEVEETGRMTWVD
jgi:hypothetical protein